MRLGFRQRRGGILELRYPRPDAPVIRRPTAHGDQPANFVVGAAKMRRHLEASERRDPLDQCEADAAHPGEFEFGLGGGSGKFKRALVCRLAGDLTGELVDCSASSAPARGMLRP